MNTLLSIFPVIYLESTAPYYDFFYNLAFLFGFLLLFWLGKYMKFNMLAWLIMIAGTYTGLIIGSKLGAFGMDEWKLIFSQYSIPTLLQKSAVGGLIFGLLFLWFFRKFIRFNYTYLHLFAFFFPVFIVVQRVGCLLAGCCYGNPTDHFWGIAYQMSPSDTNNQLTQIHPIPIYLIIGALITIGVLIYFYKKVQNKVTLLYLSLTCLFITRFITEFFRDPLNNHNLQGLNILGMKLLQWVLIIAIAIFCFLMKKSEKQKVKEIESNFEIERLAFAFFMLIVIVFGAIKIFTPQELFIVQGMLIIGFGFFFYELLYRQNLSIKWIPMAAIFFSFFTMSQTFIDTNRTHTFSFNFNRMDFKETYYPCDQLSTGCGENYCISHNYKEPHGPIYKNYKFGYDYLSTTNRKGVKFNMGLNVSNDIFLGKLNYQEKSFAYLNYHPYIGYQGKYTSLRLGLHFGQIYKFSNNLEHFYSALPSVRLDIGNERDLFNFRISVADDEYINAGMNLSGFYMKANTFTTKNKFLKSIGVGYSDFYLNKGHIIYSNIDFRLTDGMLMNFTLSGLIRSDSLSNNNKTNLNQSLNYGIGLKFLLRN